MQTDIRKLASIVCQHVALNGLRIGKAIRSEPVVIEDSGWQFLCGKYEIEDDTKAEVWAVQEVLNVEPSLKKWIDATPNVTLIRDDGSEFWRETNSDK